MEIIEEEDFEKADELKPIDLSGKVTEEEFQRMIESMQNPVQAQQQIAAQIKKFLDMRIKQEISEKGILSDHTRRWVETFTNILNSIQKALYGDKNVNLHMHQIVSHSTIATKIRKLEKKKEV